MVTAADLKVELFADGADLDHIAALGKNPLIKGFTTNPTLMRNAGVADYEQFGRRALEIVGERPISFEVFSDEFDEMEKQAHLMSQWGRNVFVKIPVTNTRGAPSTELIRRLSGEGVRLNVTAVFTEAQAMQVAAGLAEGPGGYVSVFAGRIADAGVDPVGIMGSIASGLATWPHLRLIWASPREVLNIVQADQVGCHVITLTHDLLAKVANLGKDLEQFSLETVQMFRRDAVAAGYAL